MYCASSSSIIAHLMRKADNVFRNMKYFGEINKDKEDATTEKEIH